MRRFGVIVKIGDKVTRTIHTIENNLQGVDAAMLQVVERLTGEYVNTASFTHLHNDMHMSQITRQVPTSGMLRYKTQTIRLSDASLVAALAWRMDDDE